MIRILSLVVLSLLAGIPAGQAAESSLSTSSETRILVTFSDPALGSGTRVSTSRPGYKRGSSAYLVSLGVKRAARRIARDFNLEAVDEWPILSLKVHCLVYAVPASMDLDDLLKRLRQDPEVDSAQPLNEFEVSTEGTSVDQKSYKGLQHSLETLELETGAPMVKR